MTKPPQNSREKEPKQKVALINGKPNSTKVRNPFPGNIRRLSRVLRTARWHAGLTQEQLARIMKTKQSSIARAENGNVASIRFAERLVKACGGELRLDPMIYIDDSIYS